MRRLSLGLPFLVILACSPQAAPPPPTSATISGAGFTVQLEADPFSLQLRDAAGKTTLSTASGPRFTFDEHAYQAQVLPGWDGYASHERPWNELTHGVLEQSD